MLIGMGRYIRACQTNESMARKKYNSVAYQNSIMLVKVLDLKQHYEMEI